MKMFDPIAPFLVTALVIVAVVAGTYACVTTAFKGRKIKDIMPVVYICTSWKYPGIEHYVRRPDPETRFSGNGFLGFHYDFFTFRDVKTGKLKQISSQDSFACEPFEETQ